MNIHSRNVYFHLFLLLQTTASIKSMYLILNVNANTNQY